MTRDGSYTHDGITISNSLETALEKASENKTTEIFIIGGAQIYKQSLHFADRLYLTLIEDEKEADAFFPEYKKEFTKELSREEKITQDGLKYVWIVLEKR